MKKSIYYAVFCLACLSCKKDEPAPPPIMTLTFTQTAINYVKLNQGDYFIYKDSATGMEDSIVVTLSRLQPVRVPMGAGTFQGMPEHDAQQFDLIMTSQTSSPATWLNVTASTEHQPIYTACDTVPMRLTGNSSPILTYFEFSHHQNTQSYPAMTIDGRTYYFVIAITSEYGTGPADPDYIKSTCYWSKGVGIIKRQTITAGNNIKTQTLLRHN